MRCGLTPKNAFAFHVKPEKGFVNRQRCAATAREPLGGAGGQGAEGGRADEGEEEEEEEDEEEEEEEDEEDEDRDEDESPCVKACSRNNLACFARHLKRPLVLRFSPIEVGGAVAATAGNELPSGRSVLAAQVPRASRGRLTREL